MKRHAIRRFKSKTKILENGCHEWQSTIKNDGYAGFWFEGKPQLGHRVAWQLFMGEIPENSLVLHRCDNRICVNPKHLYLGSYTDNAQDMHVRERFVGHRHLSDQHVRMVFVLLADGRFSQTAIAEVFGVTQTAISKIKTGRTWSESAL